MYSDKGHGKGAEAHYSTMSFDDMAAMRDDILFATAPNAVLFMWTTWAADPSNSVDHLQQSMDLMRHWGFERKTGGHWTKTTIHGKQAFGTGYIMRSADEPFIIGTIGNPRIKNHSQRNQIFTGDVPDNINDLGINKTIPSSERHPVVKSDGALCLAAIAFTVLDGFCVRLDKL